MKHLYGLVCATITPMFQDGSIDIESGKQLYANLQQEGVHGLYPNGTNGESLSLAETERKALATACVQSNNARSVVYIQCGSQSVQESYSNALHARSVGADGVGLMTPVFFPMDDASLETYYMDMLAQLDGFPLYVYNIASRTGNDVSIPLFSRLRNRFNNLLGIKFSSADLIRFLEYTETGADVLIGCDSLALSSLVLGGTGFVSGPGAVFARWYIELYNAFHADDIKRAMQMQARIRQFSTQMADIPEIPAVKYMLQKKKLIRYDTCRRPLRMLTPGEKARLDELLEESRRCEANDF